MPDPRMGINWMYLNAVMDLIRKLADVGRLSPKPPDPEEYMGWAMDQEKQGFVPEADWRTGLYGPSTTKDKENRAWHERANAARRRSLEFLPSVTERNDNYVLPGEMGGGFDQGPSWRPSQPQLDERGLPWA